MVGCTSTQLSQALVLGPLMSILGKQKMRALTMTFNTTNLLFIRDLLQTGKVQPIVDKH